MRNLGDLQIHKGELKGTKLVMWDAVPDCTEECSIYEECHYQGNRKKCELRQRYLESVMKEISETFGEEKDPMTMLQIGMILMPLFTQLVSFKIHAHSIGDRVMYGTRVHPIFKEIRQTTKSISETLKDLGVTKRQTRKGNYLDGDSDYYDTMIANGEIAK
jgi:hypothetical protein